ncbi:MAG TPA: SGNH/GDSL hydrolase family protein [Sphingobacteriaceae bacterium]|nr:SGNH/GDSL hydrolase family protein [Sphingobacteriaceae bacterium]
MKRRIFIKSGISLGALFLLPDLATKASIKRLPKVLIIGDSISMGYTPFVQKLLQGKAVVTRPNENCFDSGNGLKKADIWLNGEKFDIIHFNFGLHDLKHIDKVTGKVSSKIEDPVNVELSDYALNLQQIIEKFRKSGAKLIFATTTPVPENSGSTLRLPSNPPKYNQTAIKVMKYNKVVINDLYKVVMKNPTLQKPNNVHFTDKGSEILARQVTKAILKEM